MAGLRGFLFVTFALPFVLVGAPAFAQMPNNLTFADPSASPAPKPHPKKNAHKDKDAATTTGQPASEEAEKAAHLAEGRKKFFERSMGFDEHGSSTDSPVTLDSNSSGGISPSVGMKF